MQSNRKHLLDWIDQDLITSTDLDLAVDTAQAQPSIIQWQGFIKQALLWLTVCCLCIGTIFFFAYNWQALSRFSRFALAQSGLLVCSVLYLFYTAKPLFKTALLMAMILLTGALLALIGQTYQTGADPWQLFAYWCVFILPWVFIANSHVVWIFWFALVNIAFTLYINSNARFLSENSNVEVTTALILFLLNSAFLVFFELNAFNQKQRKSDVSPRFVQCVLFCIITFFICALAIDNIFDANAFNLLYLSWLITSFCVYRYVIKDLFNVSCCALSFVIISTCYIVELNDSNDWEAQLFLTGLYILISSTAMGYLLKSIKQRFDSPTLLEKQCPLSGEL